MIFKGLISVINDWNSRVESREVKTTTGNEFEPFYLSTSEMEALKRLNNYWIYRVYNFNLDLGKEDLYKIDCSKELNTHYNVKTSEYKVSPKR